MCSGSAPFFDIWKNDNSFPLAVRCGHAICFDPWDVSRNNVYNFQSEAFKNLRVTFPCLSSMVIVEAYDELEILSDHNT